MPSKWTYDEVIDAAYIFTREVEPAQLKTIHLEGVEVLLDVDTDGNVLGIELLGDTRKKTVLRDLGKYLKTDPNVIT